MGVRRRGALIVVAGLWWPGGPPQAAAQTVQAVPGIQGAQMEWLTADPDYEWSFPRDHGPHAGYRTEWWYFTGQLSTDPDETPRFGYQFTVFKVGIVPERPDTESSWAASDVLMGHVAVTDLVTGRHVFSEVVRRAVPMLAAFGPVRASPSAGANALDELDAVEGDVLARVVAPPGTAGEWRLAWTGSGFAFEMADAVAGIAFDLTATLGDARSGDGVVFQGPNGFSRKADADGHASMYYSLPRLATNGVLTIDGVTVRVVGDTWMDHEFSSDPLAEDQVGWDWHSIRLSDGRALMAFLLRDSAGQTNFAHATLVEADGTVRYLSEDLWTAEPLRTWTSGETGGEYPVEWRIEIPSEGLSLGIEPLLDAQENVGRLIDGLFYWEGAVRATDPSGVEVGRGYLELTGYGTSAPPAL